jgi:hypothetical protein
MNFFLLKRVVILISFGFSIAACTTPTASVKSNFTLSPDTSSGLLVGSVKYSGLLSGYRVYFRGVNNNQSGYFEAGKGVMLIPVAPKSDFKHIRGKLQVTELPPGDYEITRWGVISGYANLSQTSPFKVHFKIEAGKATYIGSFIFSVTQRMGLTVTGVNVNFEDRYKEDIAVLRKKYPKLGNTEIYMGIEPGLIKESLGGTSSTSWNMPPVFVPVN